MYAEPSLPLTGNICDRRRWRIKGASVGVAVDFVRRSKPHKQNRTPQEGNRWHTAGVSEGEKAINIKFSLSLPQSFFKRKMTAPSSEGACIYPTFAGFGQGRTLSLRYTIYFSSCAVRFYYTTFNFHFFTLHSSLLHITLPAREAVINLF